MGMMTAQDAALKSKEALLRNELLWLEDQLTRTVEEGEGYLFVDLEFPYFLDEILEQLEGYDVTVIKGKFLFITW